MSKARISELEHLIIKHKNLYYQGKAEIADEQYDALENELKKLDSKNPVLEIVGTKVFSGEKVEHQTKMLSLNKTYKLDELIKWKEDHDVLSTFKIDGSSCSLIYKNGLIEIAKTRGDGRFGENITPKVLNIPHVPKKIKDDISMEVRGEIYCTEENFLKLSKEMEKRGLDKPTSQRNIVAGLLGRKENVDLSKYLSFQAFEMFTEDRKDKTESAKFKALIEMGFETPDFYINKTKKDLEQRLAETKDFIAEGDYLIDGLVLSYNDLDLHDKLGETAHHPRYKMAFKFQGDTKVTKIESISWQVSRNGYLTPVANVLPVELSGAKVSRVTLHNYGMVKQFNLKIGDEIEIVRSGEVIPKFLEVKKESSNKFEVPTVCPSCKEKVIEQEIRLVCVNTYCPDKVKDEILNFVKKIGIDDLSSKRLEEMIRLGFIKDIPSLYELTREQLMSMDKVKDKLADKLLASIENSKNADLVTFLASLGISGGAFNKCEKIVSYGFNTISKVLKMSVSDLEMIESFAEKSATDFIDSLNTKKEIIKKLKEYGFKFSSNMVKVADSEITGLKFCITGTLSMKRNELQKIVKENGGIVQAGVSKDTNYLITNDTESSSSKFKKAQNLKIPIINEQTFFKLIGKQ